MIVGVDASNIRAGGGVTHLKKILENIQPSDFNITKIIIWGGGNPLDQLPQKTWLDLQEVECLNSSLLARLLWQQNELGNLARKNCDILFVPGGLYLGDFVPYVTMFQNMQIFETKELNRENGKEWLRLKLLQLAQGSTFKNSAGVITLSEYSNNYLTLKYQNLVKNTKIRIIEHGSNNTAGTISQNCKCNGKERVKVLYVSSIKKYKHQWNLIDALGLLKKDGLSVELHLIGGGDKHALGQMCASIKRNSSIRDSIFYHGNLTYEETLSWYNKADIFVFPSTCETFGISLLEAMAVGLPIASSDRGPLPEVLKDAGLYFNPESVLSIKDCLQYLIEHPSLQQKLGRKAQKYSEKYSWRKCANETFSFLRDIYEENKK